MAAQTKVHVSQIKTYQTCPRMYYFNYVLKLVPKVENSKLLFGRGIHLGLAEYYSTGQLSAALTTYNTWLDEQRLLLMGSAADPDHLAEASRLGEVLLKEYIAFAGAHDDFEPVAVEQDFEVPIWTPKGRQSRMMHRGRIDLIVRDRYGKLWLGEHKTAKDAPVELSLQLDFQASAYMVAATQLFGQQITGVVYNVIRKVDPAKARTPVIIRKLVVRTAHELLATATQMYQWARRMLTDKEFSPISGRHCSWQCAYSSLCLCMQDGTDYRLLADALYETRKEVIEDASDDNIPT